MKKKERNRDRKKRSTELQRAFSRSATLPRLFNDLRIKQRKQGIISRGILYDAKELLSVFLLFLITQMHSPVSRIKRYRQPPV